MASKPPVGSASGGVSVPVPVNIDRIRAGQIVRVDGDCFVVTKFRMDESCYLMEDGPVASGPPVVEIDLQRARPPDPGSPIELATGQFAARLPFTIDGHAYVLDRAEFEQVTWVSGYWSLSLRLSRAWWNDPKGPA